MPTQTKNRMLYGSCQGPLDFPMRDEDARELEKKLDSGEYSPFRMQKSEFEYFIEGEHADVSIINDASIDKDGEIVDPDSLDFTKYRKNPLVTFNHNYDIPPIGKSIWQKRVGGVWKAKTVYTSKPDEYPKDQAWFPDTLFHMIKSGTMRGKSVGGAAAWREPTEEDASRLGFEFGTVKRITKSVEVWEYAACPIGVNSNTVVELVSKGMQVPDILLEEFPEVAEFLKQQKEKEEEKEKHKTEIPIIKSFLSVGELDRHIEIQKQQRLIHLEKQIPQMVENALKRTLGKVC